MKAYRYFAALLLAPFFFGGLPAAAQSISGIVQGVPVRTAIDVASLEASRVHRYFLPAGKMPTGQDWLVPVVVVKGAKKGPKFLVVAGVHGDELNGIGVAHRLLEEIQPENLAGTLTVIPGVNVPGILAGTRNYPLVNGAGRGVGTNLNREMPGDVDSVDPGTRFASRIWSGIIQGNADFAVDVHTKTQGSAYPLYVFADTRKAGVEDMARLLGPDMIKIDPGQAGTVETTLNNENIPAVTLEVGGARVFQLDLIERAVLGLKRLMAEQGMLDENIPAPRVTPLIGNDTASVHSARGGIAMLDVALLDLVREGQRVAVLRDSFGRVTEELFAPRSGHISSIATDPLREEGAMVVQILWNNPSRVCKDGC